MIASPATVTMDMAVAMGTTRTGAAMRATNRQAQVTARAFQILSSQRYVVAMVGDFTPQP